MRLRTSGPTGTAFWNDVPEVPLQGLARPFQRTGPPAAGRAVLVFEALEGLGRGVNAQGREGGRPGNDIDRDEQDDRRHEKRWNEGGKPPEDKRQHRSRCPGAGGVEGPRPRPEHVRCYSSQASFRGLQEPGTHRLEVREPVGVGPSGAQPFTTGMTSIVSRDQLLLLQGRAPCAPRR